MKQPRDRQGELNAPLLAAVIATLLCVAALAGHQLGAFEIPGLDAIELNTLDARFAVRGERQPQDHDIVIVGFDNKLRERAPEAFQKREKWGEFFERLATYAPLAVGVDAFFSSPETALPGEVVDRVRQAHVAIPAEATATLLVQAREALGGVLQAIRGDELLAAALSRSKGVHLGVMFFLEDGELDPHPAQAPEPAGLRGALYDEGTVLTRPPGLRPPKAEGRRLSSSMDMFATAAGGAGFTNVIKDTDGKVRRVWGAIEHGGRYYMPLGLALARKLAGPGAELRYMTGDRAIALGDRRLAVDRRGILTLDWLGRGGEQGTFRHISAADVLDGSAPAESLRGKLVFVGLTDAARDRLSTPLDPNYPGVEVHATLAYNALHGGLLRRVAPWWTLIITAMLGAILSLLSLRSIRQQRTWLGSAAAAALVFAWLIASQVLFAQALIVEVAAPAASCVLVALATLSTALITEGREKARIRTAFSQYVTGALVERILADPAQVRLGGVRRELSVLFSDIRGFSRFSEHMDPEALSSFLNEYLTPMTRLVLDEGGMLDKYIGDAVMAVYGAPLPMQDHAAAACRTALAMQRRLTELNRDWQARDLPRVDIGVGLNSGTVSVGNMGSEMRFDYTVMGDTVNLGARLEALTKEYGAGILVGEATRLGAGDAFVFRELDMVRVKGRDGAVRVYELLGEAGVAGGSPRALQDMADWDEAMALHRARRWDEAEACFARWVARDPDDRPARTMVARVRELREDPQGAQWDGVYEQRGK